MRFLASIVPVPRDILDFRVAREFSAVGFFSAAGSIFPFSFGRKTVASEREIAGNFFPFDFVALRKPRNTALFVAEFHGIVPADEFDRAFFPVLPVGKETWIFFHDFFVESLRDLVF